MFESTIEILSSVPWFWVLVIAFFTTLIENLFPPAPGDSVIVFAGTLIAIGSVGFVPLLIATTLGSVVGFVIMFLLGRNVDEKIMHSSVFSFISRDGVKKVEGWFQKYGYALIIANRFLSGTRAVISFFAGMSHLIFWKTVVLSALSALLWNGILLALGALFGEHLEEIFHYMELYGKILLPIGGVIIIGLVINWYIKNRKSNQSARQSEEL